MKMKKLFEKMNIEEFVKQAETLEKDDFGKIAELGLSHPHILNRIKALYLYQKSNYAYGSTLSFL